MVSVHAVEAGNERNHARSDAALRFLFSGDSRRFGQIQPTRGPSIDSSWSCACFPSLGSDDWAPVVKPPLMAALSFGRRWFGPNGP
ncbi:hypothetical protein JCGZ_23701 [Jatropha curcas]|uniref:Uncharacterized protein n=1 Tax=Jatropha curcas TaxID=180498 RepID=A0A067L2T7_JATCU|nr:hypothetical protein JCGZ_23701 [Jatropha curcas]